MDMPVNSRIKSGLGGFLASALLFSGIAQATVDIAQAPLFINSSVPPLNMLVMGRDHKLYYEAYNDVSDLDGDGHLEVRFKPSITYYGYFDSGKCYAYSSDNGRFEPRGQASTNNTCPDESNGAWSGNFLNYITTSRIDAMRKVLYGGKRSTDTRTESTAGVTVLERSHIPQDGHSWGKEYASVAVDGYDIASYTPLSLPSSGTRHLFANTSLTSAADTPLMRVLINSQFRIWDWVSKERPVADTTCMQLASSSVSCVRAGGTDTSHPTSSAQFQNLIALVRGNAPLTGYDNAPVFSLRQDSYSTGNADNYVTVIEGALRVPSPGGTYHFSIDGDDNVELLVNGVSVASRMSSGGHGICTGAGNNVPNINGTCANMVRGSLYLAPGDYPLEMRHEEVTGGDAYNVGWRLGDTGSFTEIPVGNLIDLRRTRYPRTFSGSTMTDYTVRVQVCAPDLLESNCQAYHRTSGSNTYTTYKPVGLLQEFGVGVGDAAARMKFGLLTGSYRNNLQGGVLRRGVGDISDELDTSTGQFSTVNGIIKTIDKLKIVGYNGSSHGSNGSSGNCGLIETRALNNNECNMWGNPVAEMMYESLRYFAGKGAATSSFVDGVTSSGTGTYDGALGLPLATWDNPYAGSNAYACAAPVQTIISDINPSYDTDSLPGSAFSSFTSDVAGLDVSTLGQTIWNGEFGSGTTRQHYIGQSDSVSDGAPSAKSVSSFGNIRGLAPEEPTKLGGYYAASVAYHGLKTDLNSVTGNQKLSNYVVALASPLPQFRIPVGNRYVTLVPFGKSVGHGSAYTNYFPTNTIVDFYVEEIADDGSSGTFRINFEDVEQGNDHDMDAIVRYSYQVSGDELTINLSSDYAAGSVRQHMGYVISGTTRDGVYLEVRDKDTNEGDDYEYALDTLPGSWAGEARGNGKLPLTASRTFTVNSSSTATTASLLKGPLWYAAKWGGFTDRNGNGIPDLREEWTSAPASNADPDPDNYYLVTNALGLRDKLASAFNNILLATTSASAVATNSTRLDTGTQVFQARFNSEHWSGELRALNLRSDGSIGGEAWEASELIPAAANRTIVTWDHAAGTGGEARSFAWDSLSSTYQDALRLNADGSQATEEEGQQRLSYLRGDTSREQRNGGTLRNRPGGVLGDIVNSDPVYVGNQGYGFERLPVGSPERPSDSSNPYETFKTNMSRKGMVYVGANDGMLHGFCAGNCGSVATGTELFAYAPGGLASEFYRLTLPSYQHRYFVDGSARVSDAYLGTGEGAGWATVLTGSLGAGGRSVFALDVTNPDAFSTSKVLWEFPNGSTPNADKVEMGQGITQPTIARLKADNKWVAIFGNGYNSQSGQASLFIVDLNSGALLKRIPVGTAGSNGLAAPVPVDTNGDRITDYVYAGDLQGNVWRFDLNGTTQASWAAGLGGRPVFKTKTGQPVTTRITVGSHPSGGVMLYFGTGRFLGESDRVLPDSPTVQSFYGIWDSSIMSSGGATIATNDTSLISLTDLQRQTIVYQSSSASTASGAATFPVRVISDTSFTYGVASAAGSTATMFAALGLDENFAWGVGLGNGVGSGNNNGNGNSNGNGNNSGTGGGTSTDTSTGTGSGGSNTGGNNNGGGNNNSGGGNSSGGSTGSSGGSKQGWYLDLVYPSTATSGDGERVVSPATLRGGKVIFTTVIPSSNACSYGGSSWLMEIDALSGGRLEDSVFDVNGDGLINDSDFANMSGDMGSVGGKKFDELIRNPGIISAGEVEYKYTSGSSGNVGVTIEDAGSAATGRQSWRQLQ